MTLGGDVTRDLDAAQDREWLVTNGIGGYASGSVAGSLTRGYHGILVAALRPPIDRRLMAVKLDETVTYMGQTWALATNRWQATGVVSPAGYLNLDGFELDGGVARWRFTLGDARIEKTIWMAYGANTTFVRWAVTQASGPVDFTVRAITDNRIFHNTGSPDTPRTITVDGTSVTVTPGDPSGLALRLYASTGAAQAARAWDRDFFLPVEQYRGLNDLDSHLQVATYTATLQPGDAWTLAASAEDPADPQGTPDWQGALTTRQAHDAERLKAWQAARSAGPWPDWAEALVYAADQCVVRRAAQGDPEGRSVIAGYHWFEDWGRDTMISLPGLTLATGRADEAATILRTFARYVDPQVGLLPNRFPDVSEAPQYNTMDATLWFFQAIRAYHEATGDLQLLKDLWPTLVTIIQRHQQGTCATVNGVRFTIKADARDGLLAGGAPGVQLTWMDAIVDGRVITPRIGKPIEINALWYNALRAMARFAAALGEDGAPYTQAADRVAASFPRFWNTAAGYCYDVLDGPDGPETHLRPNQLFALSLPEPLLTPAQQAQVLKVCTEHLLTEHGLRSLAPNDPAYVGHYGGDQTHRDGAYHQGTVWGWLIGPYVSAHLRLNGDPQAALDLLAPLGRHLSEAGLGTVSEIFDGDAPFTPRGCIAQAWSVGELLRVTDQVVAALGRRSAPKTQKTSKASKA
ncbi:MAG: glycogen debranching enzyme family protein [Myxococcales bacterium]|nr:glycogen debranching enzyme family protein [Myxococcales bacterium]